MSTEKVCPKCETAMIEGFTADQTDGGTLRPVWVQGKPETCIPDRIEKIAPQAVLCAGVPLPAVHLSGILHGGQKQYLKIY